MTDNEALNIVRNPWGRSEREFVEARLYLCDRFEQLQVERDNWEFTYNALKKEDQKLEAQLRERNEFCDNLKGHWRDMKKQRNEAAAQSTQVEEWLFRAVDILSDEFSNGELTALYNDMAVTRKKLAVEREKQDGQG